MTPSVPSVVPPSHSTSPSGRCTTVLQYIHQLGVLHMQYLHQCGMCTTVLQYLHQVVALVLRYLHQVRVLHMQHLHICEYAFISSVAPSQHTIRGVCGAPPPGVCSATLAGVRSATLAGVCGTTLAGVCSATPPGGCTCSLCCVNIV